MAFNRLPRRDPRTVAREIPGIMEVLFPQLTPSVVRYLNGTFDYTCGSHKIAKDAFEGINTQHSLLFEISYEIGESLLSSENKPNFDQCIERAIKRQKKHFDFSAPRSIPSEELELAKLVGENLYDALSFRASYKSLKLESSPMIPGFKWISSSAGDFALGTELVEVKCSRRNFGSADYRQLLIYWLMSYLGKIEGKCEEWSSGLLINPRRNTQVEFDFPYVLKIVSGGRTEIEIVELFKHIIGEFSKSIEF